MRGNSDRFYLKSDNLGEDILLVEDKVIIKQWTKVMRFREGDEVRLFDGSGWGFNYQLSMINYQSNVKNQGSKIHLKLINKEFIEEKRLKIYLGFGILKDRTRMEWMMEKCTELGVDGFVPLITDNCQIINQKSKIKNQKVLKIERLEKKIIEACEQSGRVRVPEIQDVMKVEDVLVRAIHELPLRIVVMEKTLNSKNKTLKTSNNEDVLLLVGPEGGWSEREFELFKEKKVDFLSVSDNVLRAETAGVVGLVLTNWFI